MINWKSNSLVLIILSVGLFLSYNANSQYLFFGYDTILQIVGPRHPDNPSPIAYVSNNMVNYIPFKSIHSDIYQPNKQSYDRFFNHFEKVKNDFNYIFGNKIITYQEAERILKSNEHKHILCTNNTKFATDKKLRKNPSLKDFGLFINILEKHLSVEDKIILLKNDIKYNLQMIDLKNTGEYSFISTISSQQNNGLIFILVENLNGKYKLELLQKYHWNDDEVQEHEDFIDVIDIDDDGNCEIVTNYDDYFDWSEIRVYKKNKKWEKVCPIYNE